MYSIFAALTLLILLLFQYSFQSELLISSVWIKYISLMILVLPGFVIMILSIYKYFRLLSGIRSLYEAVPAVELKIEGIHKYVRHPLYAGTMLFIWGLFLIFPFLNNLIAVVIITVYIIIGIQLEEKKLEIEFGKFYFDYKAKVPMLLPFFKKSIK
ncbi:MAG: methyltransferase [Ginsengibacter sp.]